VRGAEVGGFRESSQFSAGLSLLFFGENRKDAGGVLGSNVVLTIGTGPDHAIFDIYIGGSLWQSFDGYAATPGQRDIPLEVHGDGPHRLELRNRAKKHPNSSGTKLRFKQLVVADTTWTLHTIRYAYDNLARLLEARYAPGINALAGDGDLLRRYLYGFDRAGNRLSQSLALNGGTPTVTNHSYNAANQLISDGVHTLTYNNNGNLTSDGVNSYSWDRANRLTGVGGAAYQYDGDSRRVQQTVSSVVTQYLLDIQPGLSVVLAETTGTDVTRYVHAPSGIHAQQDAQNQWEWLAQDGLGSVRSVVSNTVDVLESRLYGTYGEAVTGTPYGYTETPYGFTGEPTDANGLLYLRARYYSPNLGVFTSLDPFEGMANRPMSLNGYLYVEGNTPNWTDPSGYTLNEDQIIDGLAEYSCHCGWIDWDHTDNYTLMVDVLENLLYAGTDSAEFWGIRTRLGVGGIPLVGWLVLFDDLAVVPDTEIKRRTNASPRSVEDLAISILMDANQAFEATQFGLESVPGVSLISNSGYSEEDYVSDLIGAYMGSEIVFNHRDLESDIKAEVRQMCCAFGKDASLEVWRDTYEGGKNLRYGANGWKSWYPRLLTLLDCNGNIDLSNTPSGICNQQTRQFPTKLADLAGKYIRPQVNGAWWWLAGGFTGHDGVYMYPGNREYHSEVRLNLYKLNRLYFPQQPPQLSPTPIGTPPPGYG
jgi:RHS repeat-associated protein